MARKRHKADEIVNKLRQADVELGKGSTVASMCRILGVTEVTYFRWRKEYGGMKADQAKRFKRIEQENLRLKRLLAEAAQPLNPAAIAIVSASATRSCSTWADLICIHKPHQSTRIPEAPFSCKVRWGARIQRNRVGRPLRPVHFPPSPCEIPKTGALRLANHAVVRS